MSRKKNKTKIMKKVYKFLLLIVIMCASNYSFAQANMEDVLYLKNGSIIRGVIIEQIINKSVKIQTKDRSVFVFKYDEIEKITRENLPTEDKSSDNKNPEFKIKGFTNITTINYSPGIGNIDANGVSVKNEDYSIGLKTINGYQFNNYFSLGVGIGIDKYKEISLIPITVDVSVNLLKSRVSPTLNAGIGYSLGLADASSGIIIHPSVGLKVFISKNIAYTFNLGYRLQEQTILHYNYNSNYHYYSTTGTTTKLFYQFITINTGFVF
jgi:hypothetical protein